jgi:hypothetical protein
MFDPGTLIQHVNVRSLIAMYICNSMSIRLILGERYAIDIGDYVIIKHNWKALNARTSRHVV